MDQPYPQATEDGYLTISFYSFFEIPEHRLQLLHDRILSEWSQRLGVVGRIYIYDQGINAQLSVPAENARALREWLETNQTLSGRVPRFNWALEHRRAFRALHVRIRPLVGTDRPLDLETLGHEPEYLGPEDWERELRERGDGALLVDMRNQYEHRVGRFENAVCPSVDTFREEIGVVRKMCRERGPDEPIYMYCTGGIRCSVAGAILKAEGHTNIKTLQGGVIAYGRHVQERAAGGESLFRGKNFTFDKRLGEEVTSEVLSKCDQCGGSCDRFTNCANVSCNLLFIQCPSCAARHQHTCGNALCIERAQMPEAERAKRPLGPMWDYHQCIRPDKAFGEDGIARPDNTSHNSNDNSGSKISEEC
ncbi:hypothetical protein GGF46_000386 [Coemansia sp. RSA 552]|nr:hypothetical protein GGF46_000386 [Coemansia sp. RSA 552]